LTSAEGASSCPHRTPRSSAPRSPTSPSPSPSPPPPPPCPCPCPYPGVLTEVVEEVIVYVPRHLPEVWCWVLERNPPGNAGVTVLASRALPAAVARVRRGAAAGRALGPVGAATTAAPRATEAPVHVRVMGAGWRVGVEGHTTNPNTRSHVLTPARPHTQACTSSRPLQSWALSSSLTRWPPQTNACGCSPGSRCLVPPPPSPAQAETTIHHPPWVPFRGR
jgi:hypothetical protein